MKKDSRNLLSAHWFHMLLSCGLILVFGSTMPVWRPVHDGASSVGSSVIRRVQWWREQPLRFKMWGRDIARPPRAHLSDSISFPACRLAIIRSRFR